MVKIIKNAPESWKNCHTISYRGSKGVAPGVKMGGAGGQNGWFLAQESWGQKGWRQGVNRAPPFLLVQHFFLILEALFDHYDTLIHTTLHFYMKWDFLAIITYFPEGPFKS